MMMMRGFGRGGGSSSTRCQDCGNQAKRDCAYMRCRTCCKGKGYDCQTHIKSTWLPSVGTTQKLKHHHLHTQTLLPPPHHHHLHQHHHGGDDDDQHLQLLLPSASVHPQNPRWLREIPSTGFEGEEMVLGRNMTFPAEAILPATLRCIRIRSMDDSATQYSYQAAVSIGGHVFKGILYDHGAVAEPHQPNLANAHHQTLIASTSSAGDDDLGYSHNIVVSSSSSSCPILPFNALMMPGVDFFQHSSTPKSP